MIKSNSKNLKLDVCGNGTDENEIERQRIKRIRESTLASELPALQLAYELAKSEPPQPRTHGLANAERVLFGLPIDKL